jgi:hypothetical protein
LKMKSKSISYLFNESEDRYWILDLEGEVHSIWDLYISAFENARALVFPKSGGRATIFGRVQKIWIFGRSGCLCPNLPPPKSLWGEV